MKNVGNDYCVYIKEDKTALEVNTFLDNYYYQKENKLLFTQKRNQLLARISSSLNKYSKRLDNITTITANNITVEARGISGYINSKSGYNEYVGESGYTVDVQKVTGNPYAITVTIQKSSAYTNITNNTPIVMNGYFKFTLS